MFRPVISYLLTSIILLSQVGVPLHMHYCRGALEVVSVFFSAKCKDHPVPVNLPECCRKALAKDCTKDKDKKCCDDEVVILKQNITSITPSFAKWIDVLPNVGITEIGKLVQAFSPSKILIEGNSSDSGPPIYILNSSLIFYA